MDNLHISRFTYFLSLILLCLSSFCLMAEDSPYSTGDKPPEWLKQISVPQGYEIPHASIQNGTYYVLVDEQTRVDSQRNVTSFNRYVTEIVNQKGLEFNFQVEMEFDPVYQQVQVHSLQVTRDGKVLNKLSDTEFSLLHKEEELSSQLYNGTHTLHGIIPDLRNGDILEYSYSVLGQNPVFSGAFSEWRQVQWGVPLEKLHISFLMPSDLPLYHSFINLEPSLQQEALGQELRYIYTREQVPASYVDDERPGWHTANSHLLVSTRESWQEVAKWGAELFAEPMARQSPEIDTLVQTIRADNPDQDQQIMAVINFVQNEIRYFGIELGESSHKPSFAEQTLARRFGDCKDKSALLINMLRKLGVEADPVLVDSDGLAILPELVPGESWFDHAIVRIRYQGKYYWVDPTREMQFGHLASLYQKPFGHGLVLKDGETGLTEINPPPVGEIVSSDVLDLSGGRDAVVSFNNTTTFTGFNADHQRNRYANRGAKSLQKTYLDHFRNYYPGLQQEADFSFADDQTTNTVTYQHSYSIPDFWEEEDTRFKADFYSESLNYLLSEPDDIDRTHPLAIDYPEKVTQIIQVYLHDINWSFDDETETVSNDSFSFTFTNTYDKTENLLTLSYSYESHQDHVPVAALESYLQDLETARGMKNYAIVEHKKDSTDSASSTATAEATEPGALQAIWEESGDILTWVMVWLVALIVYLIWRKINYKQQPYEGEASFYAVSKTKFLLLTLITSGFYFFYWFYKNYQYEKARYRPDVMPFWRSLFHIFLYYPLFKTLATRLDPESHVDGTDTDEVKDAEVPDYAVVFAVLFVGAPIVSAVMEVWYTQVVVLTGLIMLPMTHLIAKANIKNNWLQYNSQWHPRHILLIAMFAPMAFYSLAYDLALLPDTRVVEGKTLYSHDINFMVENNIIEQDEEIAWFYSDASLFISDDGNGVTKDSVFSYWVDEEDKLNVDRASYQEIDDIRIEWSEVEEENTIIEVVTHDGEEFVLYVSNEDGLDKIFVQFLNRRLKQYH